jgi:hypothetical protein
MLFEVGAVREIRGHFSPGEGEEGGVGGHFLEKLKG